MATLSIAATLALLPRFSPARAIMLRGRHGIGKSQIVYQIASNLRHDAYKSHEVCKAVTAALGNDSGFRKALHSFWKKNEHNPAYEGVNRSEWHYDMGIPVIERRLSQMTEGDIAGLPFEGNRGGTVFRACEWLLSACQFPTVLFLDELNRAVKGVEQATFQLADSKAFDGNLLHDGTRVYIAVNFGEQYDVSPMDPAAVSRYATIDLEPTVGDWLAWGESNVHPAMVEFIRKNERFLEHTGPMEPGKKYPDRRAWGNLDAELQGADLYDDAENVTFVHMASTMVGFEAATSFWKHCKERQQHISAEQFFKDGWVKVEKLFPKEMTKRHEAFLDLFGKIHHYFQKGKLLTNPEGIELNLMMRDAPTEIMMGCFASVCSAHNDNMMVLAPLLGDFLVKISASGVTPATPPAPTATPATPPAPTATPAAPPAPTPSPRKKK